MTETVEEMAAPDGSPTPTGPASAGPPTETFGRASDSIEAVRSMLWRPMAEAERGSSLPLRHHRRRRSTRSRGRPRAASQSRFL